MHASTAQKMTFSVKDFFSKCDQIRMKLRIWLHLLKKSLMENVIFCAVKAEQILQGMELQDEENLGKRLSKNPKIKGIY